MKMDDLIKTFETRTYRDNFDLKTKIWTKIISDHTKHLGLLEPAQNITFLPRRMIVSNFKEHLG